MKKSIFFSGVAAIVLLSGCGGASSEGDCRFSTQTDLDTGNFNAVIGRLSSPSSSCRSSYVNNEWQIDLAAAYMGRAGVTVATVLSTTGSSDGSFESFVNGVVQESSSTSLEDLDNAAALYQAYVDGNISTAFAAPSLAPEPLVGSDQEASLFAGLANIAKAAIGIGGLVDDFAALADDTNPNSTKEKLKLRAAGCALQYVANNSDVCGDANAIVPTSVPQVFDYGNGNTRTFDLITVTLNNVTPSYQFLAKPDANSTIALRGTCSPDFSAGSLPCPLNRDFSKDDKLISDIVVTSLDNGFDAIANAISDESKKAEIVQYKTEIDTNADGSLSLLEITQYLQTR